MALSVVTFNIGGDGTREQKKKMINKFFSDHLPSVIYLQENPWRLDYIKNHVPKIEERYEAVSHKHPEATVLYRKDVIKDEGSSEWWRSFQDAFRGASRLDFVTFEDRASFSVLTEIQTGTSFVAISWHGEHTGLSDQLKKKKFEDLLLVINEINSKTKLPVVLGGDFNITLDSVKYSIKEKGLKVYEYDPQNRRNRVIDFFVVKGDVNLSDVSAFGNYMYEDVTVDGKKQRIKVFDHDPVEAKFSLLDLDEGNEDQTSESEDQTSESEDQTSDVYDLSQRFNQTL